MRNVVVIVADMEHFRAFTKKSDPAGREALSEITACDQLSAHGRLSDKLSDKAGNFKGSSGEAHNLVSELKKRTIEQIAREIEAVLGATPHDEWWAAFPKPIFNQIVNALSGQVRDTLKKECHADLSKTPAADILKHF